MLALVRLLTALSLVSASFAAAAQMAEGRNCGNPFDNGERYGPFDYTDPTRKTELNLVEIATFHAVSCRTLR